MDKIISKSTIKKIALMILIVTLFSFVMPKSSYALKEGGGKIFKYLAPIACLIPDLLISKLQHVFIDKDYDIAVKDPEDGVSYYSIGFSAGGIFSGQIPGFDVNFISPMGDENGVSQFTWYKNDFEQQTNEFGGKSFNIETLQKDYGLNDENMNEQRTLSDAATFVFWFRKRGSIFYLGSNNNNYRFRW